MSKGLIRIAEEKEEDYYWFMYIVGSCDLSYEDDAEGCYRSLPK